jgi:RNA polymerase-binding transcription factor DksA
MAATTKATAKKGTPNAKAAAKKVVNQTPAKKAAVKKTAVSPKKAGTAAKKAPAKKAPAKAPAKKASAAKKAAVKKATPAARKAPAKAAAKQVASPPKLPAAAGGGQIAKKAPPKRKGPLDKFLLGQVDALKEERETYTRQAVSLKAEADMLMAEREPGDVQFDEESGEGDTLAVERERDLALSAQAQAAVEEIDLALEKIKEGTYGVCEQCHNTIPKERLRALPYAALCVQCKSAGFTRR